MIITYIKVAFNSFFIDTYLMPSKLLETSRLPFNSFFIDTLIANYGVSRATAYLSIHSLLILSEVDDALEEVESFQFILYWYFINLLRSRGGSIDTFNSFFIDTFSVFSCLCLSFCVFQFILYWYEEWEELMHIIYDLSIHSLLIHKQINKEWLTITHNFQFILYWYVHQHILQHHPEEDAFNSFFIDTL